MKQPKQMIRRIVDLCMVILLPLLMAEVLIGQEIHEWLGTGMLVLFIAHHVLNVGWWKTLFKGRYTPSRCFGVSLDLLLLLDIIALGVSGIMLSGFVFDFLPISGGMAVARKLHLFASYWGLILMSAHLGLHMEMLIGVGRKLFHISGKGVARKWILRALAASVCAYGIYAFASQRIWDYLFLRTHFVMFDETKTAVVYFAETAAMIVLFAAAAHYLNKLLRLMGKKSEKKQLNGTAWKICAFAVPVLVCALVIAGFNMPSRNLPWQSKPAEPPTNSNLEQTADVQDGFVLIKGDSYKMGSPKDEPWRSGDEAQHTVTVSDFYISPYEVRQSDYESVTGENPSNFAGDNLPVENVSWLDAIAYCNALSEKENLTPAYAVDGQTVTWDRSANGYRLPTEAEWEYACRAGTATPFNTETSIGPEESNYYGHYPYEIENNYFSQGNLSTKPGEYRQTTVAVDSFSPNAWGLYNMHGNVSEWVWDFYGEYDMSDTADPTGPETGTRRVYRGGGWNDFAKNLRSAYRATLPEDKGSFNLGIRLVRNAVNGAGSVTTSGTENETADGGKVLIAFFSWGGNTRGIAEEIQSQTGADLFEIELVNPYSTDYNTVLDQAQHDQNIQARPEIKNHAENFEQYDTILLGYPNWWASIPMPIASFLEAYDFSGKTIIPFCSHGGGRFGQSLTAIAKLAPDADIGEPLSIHYSGGSTLPDDIADWLKANRIHEGEEENAMMQMKIGDTVVSVDWENNTSVEALRALCADHPLEIPMSMYGGFEQVGSLGQNLPNSDSQITTAAGDIVLYSGDQIVVFYGSNTWSYTRLGRITDKTKDEMAKLLSGGDVTVTIAGGNME